MTEEPEISLITALTGEEAMFAAYAADRALELAPPAGDGPIHEHHRAIMDDLAAAHRAHPIDFAKLHRAKASDFGHDIAGIVGKVNRKTGALPGQFKMKCVRKA